MSWSVILPVEDKLRPRTRVPMIPSTEKCPTLCSATLTANVCTTIKGTPPLIQHISPHLPESSALLAILYYDHMRFRRPRLVLSSNIYVTSQSVPKPVPKFFFPRDPDHTTLGVIFQTGSRSNRASPRYPGHYREPTPLSWYVPALVMFHCTPNDLCGIDPSSCGLDRHFW